MLARITLPETPQLTTRQDQGKIEQLELITSGIAHDFNNLLSSILGQSSLALNQLGPDDKARQHIEKAMKAAEYAALLTRQLLTYASNGRSEAVSFNLNHLISDNSTLLRTLFTDGIELRLDLDGDLPPMYAKPGEIQQVVMNLIINAAESIEADSGCVTVSTGRRMLLPSGQKYNAYSGRSGLREYLCLRVRDTGVGMDEATLGRIFDPYFTTKAEGKGLGLSAVRDIVKAHHGEIIVESKPGRGTTISVFFPCHQDEGIPVRPVH